MNPSEDDDLKLQRASASLLTEFATILPRLLRKQKPGSEHNTVRHHVRKGDLFRACSLVCIPQPHVPTISYKKKIEPFQEDPQLLDTHLKSFIPPLVAVYLEVIQVESREPPKQDCTSLEHAVCYVINLFCKVRGEKVIRGFFNNEPRYLEPILNKLEAITNANVSDSLLSDQSLSPWVDRYVLLQWLSHLLLAPFPLESMSGLQDSAATSNALRVHLPTEVPGIALRGLYVCLKSLRSASKERNAAASLLVRLCTRPDMQRIGLLDAMVQWSLVFFQAISDDQTDIHECLGVLSFLSGLVASCSNEEIGPYLARVYQTCRRILEQDNLASVKSSAVARKLMIKTFRNIVVHTLQATSNFSGIDTTIVLEEVIEYLLEALADADTPVRYGASKALSIITLKLEDDMAGEVVEAILDSLIQNVFWQGSKRNLNSVNPLHWHGLTLTLSHLLYRKAIATDHLPQVLNALLLSLGFEQRSPTGGSIGTNVRDAACFGIWALSRRYPTHDLLGVETSLIRASEHYKSITILQALAIELVTAACLDPAGNIRRGSSAALQELIGRHPNTVESGIPLVQIVDFHAVGLRHRAMCDVAIQAAELHEMYWRQLFEAVIEWRGTGSLDVSSRLSAARAVGLLAELRDAGISQQMSDVLLTKLATLKPREVEERQGLVMCLTALLRNRQAAQIKGPKAIAPLISWNLLENELKLEDKTLTSPALRPEFTAASICNFLGAMSSVTLKESSDILVELPTAEIVRLLNLCLGRYEDSVLEAIPIAIPTILQLLDKTHGHMADNLVAQWLEKLEHEASYNGSRCSGHALALGASFSLALRHARWEDSQRRIVKVLTFRCTSAVAIEARTVALRALTILLTSMCEARDHGTGSLAPDVEMQIGSALHIALNDYTITERGDIGSLVRLEALGAVQAAWALDALKQTTDTDYGLMIEADVIRISLEKLDKLRAKAAAVHRKIMKENLEEPGKPSEVVVTEDVSSQNYFHNKLKVIQPRLRPALMEATLAGYTISAGMGSETVVQNAREALINYVDHLSNANESIQEPSDDNGASLLDIATCLVKILKDNITNDRVLIPLLELIAFLFDMGIMQRLETTTFNFRVLLSNIQKAHFKSTHIQKLHLALDVYRGLSTLSKTREDTITKVVSMLLHPFPKVSLSLLYKGKHTQINSSTN